MLDDKSLLELCVKVSGGFENGGGAAYDSIAGNFDGQGLSVGVLQWNAGQGTLQQLLQKIGKLMGWQRAQTFFKSDIQQLSILKPKEAVQFCLDHYIAEGTTHVDLTALVAWKAFLSDPASISAQIEMATDGQLAHTKALVKSYCVGYQDRFRPYAFMFDLVVQSGGMQNSKGKVEEYDDDAAPFIPGILAYVVQQHASVVNLWKPVLDQDPLARLLVYYAYKRSMLSNPQYVWDALSRRGSIACRTGIVHGASINFTHILD